MNPIWIITAAVILTAIVWTLLFLLRRRSQVQFIRHELARSASSDPAGRVIAAFSTLPDRIGNLNQTIRCLLDQTCPVDEIVIAVPEFSRRQQVQYSIPQYLTNYPKVRILRCDRDWGPATKFIPVVQQELSAGRGNTLIMVVDDDRVYPNDALETYLHYHRQLPNAVLAFRGTPLPKDLVWRGPRMTRGNELRQPRRVAVIIGCGSYFIQPRFFDEQLWDYSSAPEGAFYMDDIWISGCLDRRGVEKYVVPTSRMMQTVFRQRWTMTLHDVPNGRYYNNNEAIAFFRDSWNVFSQR